MKFCYLDETGTGQSTVVIVVGVVVDAQRMHRTKRELNDLLEELSNTAGKQITELHAADLYGGNKIWRDMDPFLRDQIITKTLEWLKQRKHKITFSAVDKTKFDGRKADCQVCSELKTPEQAAAFHVVLSLQKAHKGESHNKGHTVMVFDSGKMNRSIPALLAEPPAWSDSYYSRSDKKDRLDQIVDVPFFADSKQVVLIQMADLIGFILRRYADLNDYGVDERYVDERAKIEGWVNEIKNRFYETSMRYRRMGRCPTADIFYALAPESLREL
jgi:hypothetical protein